MKRMNACPFLGSLGAMALFVALAFYFYRLDAGTFTATRSMVLLK